MLFVCRRAYSWEHLFLFFYFFSRLFVWCLLLGFVLLVLIFFLLLVYWFDIEMVVMSYLGAFWAFVSLAACPAGGDEICVLAGLTYATTSGLLVVSVGPQGCIKTVPYSGTSFLPCKDSLSVFGLRPCALANRRCDFWHLNTALEVHS